MADDNKDKRVQNEKEITSQMKQQNQQASEQSRYSQQESDAAASRAEFARSLTEELKDQMNIRRAMNETDKTTLSLARQLQTSVAQNTVELGNAQGIGKQIEKDQKLLASIESERRLAIKGLTKDQLDLASEIAEREQEKADIIDEIYKKTQLSETLVGKAKEDLEEEILNQGIKLEGLEAQLATKIKDLSTTAGISKAEIDRVAVLNLMKQNQEKNLKNKKEEEEIQKAINDKMGVTGALVEGVGGIMQRLGMRSGIFNDAMGEANEVMRDMAEKSTRVVEGFDETGKKTKTIEKNFGKVSIMLAGAGKLAGGFAKALFDPLTIILKIADAFFKVDESATKLQQITGRNSAAFAGFNDNLASTVDVLEVMADLTAQTGMNAQDIFSPQVLAGAAELKNTLGLSADAAGGLAMIAQTTSGDIDGVTESIVETTSAFNGANRSAVSQGQILRDVAQTSEGIKASLGGNPVAIAKAASAARRLGMELSQVDSIANSLMDFESSIEAELEAQLLTGKNINMAKARELALNNDLAGLGKELFKNSASLAEFGKMNRIQQEAQAKALGMTRDQLGKIAYQRALETNMTKEQAAAAAGVRLEDMERMAVQEKLAKAADKLAQAFAPMLDILIPIADLIGSIVSPIARAIGGVMKLADSIKGAEENTSAFRNVMAGVVKLITGGAILAGANALRNLLSGKGLKFDLFSKIKEKALGSKDEIEDITSSAKDKLTKSSKGLSKGGGGASKGSSSLTDSIQKIDAKKLLAGAAAMVVAAGAVFIFAKATQEFMKVTWDAVGKAIVSLVALVGAIAALGLIMSSGVGAVAILAGAAAMVIMAGALYVLGLAMQEIGTGLEKIGESVSGELLTNLFTLGPALASAAGGLALFGGAMALGGIGALIGGGMISQLQTLAALSTPLSTVGSSLTAIAAGIIALSAALSTLETEKLDEIKDLVMTTALAAPVVAASGAITSLLNGITGGGEGDSNSELLAEIKALRAVVEKGGNINMDGNKVGQFIMLSANKSA